jgi:hypothetical protein
MQSEGIVYGRGMVCFHAEERHAEERNVVMQKRGMSLIRGTCCHAEEGHVIQYIGQACYHVRWNRAVHDHVRVWT